ncbi:hypothetical protein L209DRAFT_757269 [Thermothelomyces heterothallicus CBS 203.75]
MIEFHDDANMPAAQVEKPITTAVAAPETMTKEAANNHAAPVVGAQHQPYGGSYLCKCCLCTCGEAVEYPGDVCYLCKKIHC